MLVAFTFSRHVLECRGPSVDRPAVFLRAWVAISNTPPDHAVAGDSGEPRNDLRILANGLLNAEQHRAVKVPPLWFCGLWVENEQFHDGRWHVGSAGRS